MKTFILSILIFGSVCCYSQQKAAKRDIQYLSIKDSVLLRNISLLADRMDTTNVNNNLKKEYGYIELFIDEFSKGDTIVGYYFTPQYTAIDKKKKDKVFPDFYSFVNNRLVIIDVDALNVISDKMFSNKSKRKLLALMDKCFEKPHKVIFHNMDGTVSFIDKHFRRNWFPLGAGEYIYILKNKPAIIQSSRF